MYIEDVYFPDGFLYSPDRNMWIQHVSENTAKIGLTQLAVNLYGQIFAFTPKKNHKKLNIGNSLGVIEFAKIATSVKSPINGILLESNKKAVELPHLIFKDCYNSGFLCIMQFDLNENKHLISNN